MMAIFSKIADPHPENEQRDERRGRHVPDESHQRLDQGLDGLEGSHQQAERDPDDGSGQEAGHHPVGTHQDVGGESKLGELLDARQQDAVRRGQEEGGDEPPIGQRGPDEQDAGEPHHAQADVHAGRNGFARAQIVRHAPPDTGCGGRRHGSHQPYQKDAKAPRSRPGTSGEPLDALAVTSCTRGAWVGATPGTSRRSGP